MRPIGLRYEQVEKGTRCFACDYILGKAQRVITCDGQTVFVGPDCYARINDAGTSGYQPKLGGPCLYLLPNILGAGTE